MPELDKDLIDRIVREVLTVLGSKSRKKALALICGGTAGGEEALTGLKTLRNAECDLTLVFTPAGRERYRVALTQYGLDGVPELVAGSWDEIAQCVREADVVLIPVLSLNSAAKIAHGIADNLATSLIMQALIAGKPVVAARDACTVNQLSGNANYRQIFADNLALLEKIGIALTTARELSRRVTALLSRDGGTDTSKHAAGAGDPVTGEVFPGRVLSAQDIRQWNRPVVKVGSRTLITPAAWDLARELGIEICRH